MAEMNWARLQVKSKISKNGAEHKNLSFGFRKIYPRRRKWFGRSTRFTASSASDDSAI